MQAYYDLLQQAKQHLGGTEADDRALTNVFADMFWVMEDPEGSAGDCLTDMATFRRRVSEVISFAKTCYKANNAQGFEYCLRALLRCGDLVEASNQAEEQYWLLRSALGFVSVSQALMLSDQLRWDASERLLAFAKVTTERMEAAHRIEGVPAVVKGTLRWHTLQVACELRSRAWVYGVELPGRPVYSPYEALGLLRSMPKGSNFNGAVQLAALNVAKYCLLEAKDVLPEAVGELSDRCQLEFSSKVGNWKRHASLTLLDSKLPRSMDSYLFLDFELYKEMEWRGCSRDDFNHLWELRDASLEAYYPDKSELSRLRSQLSEERPIMLGFCRDAEEAGRLRNA
jgi:hypothetical protein